MQLCIEALTSICRGNIQPDEMLMQQSHRYQKTGSKVSQVTFSKAVGMSNTMSTIKVHAQDFSLLAHKP